MFTGGGATHQGSSIEQYLAHEVGSGRWDAVCVFGFGVGTNNPGDIRDNISYLRGVTVPKMIDPVQTFNTVFVSVLAQNDVRDESRTRGNARAWTKRGGLRSARYSALAAAVCYSRTSEVEQHLTSLRELEKQLAVFEGSCQAPEAPMLFESVRSTEGGEQYFDAITNLQLDLMAQAIACDLVRFGSFWMADLSRGAVLGTGIVDDAVYTPDNPDIHETVAHAYRGPLGRRR